MGKLLEWRQEFAVGVASVDHEHQQLIGAINDVYDQSVGSADVSAIEDSLGEIYAAIAAHFALEENIMRKAGYRDYAAHKDDHEDLLEQLGDIMDDYVRDPRAGRDKLAARLGDWFGRHFGTHDAKLHGELGV